MDEIDVMACYARHDECPVCGGSTERDAVEDLGDCVRRHAGLVVCRKDGDDDDCDWAVDVPKEVLEGRAGVGGRPLRARGRVPEEPGLRWPRPSASVSASISIG